MRRSILAVLSAAAVLAFGTAALALINPRFTPVDLVEKNDSIFLVKLSAPDAKGNCTMEVKRALKGKAPAKALTINVTSGPMKEQLEAIAKMIAAQGDDPALFFVGRDEEDKPAALLHIGGKWITTVNGAKEGTWDADVFSEHMEGTWAGGTDMLLRMIELLTKHPDTEVPVEAGVNWTGKVQAGKVEGKSSTALAVDLSGDGKLALFVAAEGGDAIFRYDAKAGKFEDATAKLKLASKSRLAAWGDFTGDGRIDLASWDGKGLTIWAQAADGSFASTAATGAPQGELVGLAALDAGVKGRAGLLLSTAGAPVLLVPDKEKAGAFAARPLGLGAAAEKLKDLGAPIAALVADFDGDNVADVLQPFAQGSLIYKGKAGGEFAEAAPCPVAVGSGRLGAFVGDWDMDGRFDVMTVSEDPCRLWQNEGGGKFVNFLGISGEIAYISQPGGIAGNVCDFNNDGRQDVFLVYGDKRPLFFFNRGFRSFGHGHSVDLEEQQEEETQLPAASEGQQSGVCADLTGDGAQDLALVLLNGEVWVLKREAKDGNNLTFCVELAPGGDFAGPLTVTAENDRRSLGAWNVMPGTGPAWITRADSGDVTVSWTLPGGKTEKKTVTLENGPRRLVIGGGGK